MRSTLMLRLGGDQRLVDGRLLEDDLLESVEDATGLLSLPDVPAHREALSAGAERIGVDSLVEGIRLREAGVEVPIFVLGYTLPTMMPKAAEHDIALTISSFEALEAALKTTTTKPLAIHIKIDTGMHRQGFFPEQIEQVIEKLKEGKGKLTLEGVYTHFADAKNPSFPQNTRTQQKRFEGAVEKVKAAGFKPIVHAANTATTIVYPDAHYDMVRTGIGMYGIWPSKETRGYAEDTLTLTPAMRWKSILSEVKTVPAGGCFSYGFTECVDTDTTVGVVPVGYWHGFYRRLSSIAHVLINGAPAKVLGLISMDITIVDLSQVPDPTVGDEVQLIGPEPETHPTTIADLLGTTDYEVVTRVNPKIKRIVV